MSLVFKKAEDLPGDVEIFPVIDVDQPGLDSASIDFDKILVGRDDESSVAFFDLKHGIVRIRDRIKFNLGSFSFKGRLSFNKILSGYSFKIYLH